MRAAIQDVKSAIAEALKASGNGSLRSNATRLFNTLGYTSEKTIELTPNTPENFLHEVDQQKRLRKDKALFSKWKSVDFVFQITGEEIKAGGSAQISLQFDPHKKIDNRIIESYLFLAIKLRKGHYTRTDLSTITREINKLFPMPVLILFLNGETLTLSVINRRLHKRDKSRDVLEKVTLVKDIRFAAPHRAHIEILYDLSFANLYDRYRFSNFVALHDAWQKTLDSNELNKRFYKELANWYFWAVKEVTFPSQNDIKDKEIRNATDVIRLITRLIFVWFVKEKGLIPDDLFNYNKLEDDVLKDLSSEKTTFYKAILQNLFFATLNQEMNTSGKSDNRKFRGKRGKTGSQDQHYMIHNVYRYEAYFKNPAQALKLFEGIPFLNGGLFECLDQYKAKPVVRIDGFSDRKDNELKVPNHLFFSEERKIDLNKDYGTRNKTYKVRGIIDLLQSYKFTITENTPIEEEIALDPELLGKVFENLLASYNPETGTTARKQTGSFYTPREIVSYMVDESLIAYLEAKLTSNASSERSKKSKRETNSINARFRHLFSYSEDSPQFSNEEINALIEAIDTCKILDPACGSGAFPMGILHKLVFILGKLDPRNEQWKQRQVDKVAKAMKAAEEIDDSAIRKAVLHELEQQIANINDAFERNELDYGRKLYLIENCIFGVDIQPIAVQIAKLRFFISLVVDQKIDDRRKNRGVLPLPNLETRFVAANTLLSIEKPEQLPLRNPEIDRKEEELAKTRRKHFTARTPKTKAKYRDMDERLRIEISALLRKDGFPRETTDKLARWDPYDQNAYAEFFDTEWMFGITVGFDVVIGNPPYIRQEQIKELKPMLKREYTCYTGTADIYVYFFERGFRILKGNGILTYISSNKYFRSGYGKKLRKFLTCQATVHQLIDFGDAPVFTSIAYPSIITFSKTNPKHNQVRALNWKPGSQINEFCAIFHTNTFLLDQKELTEDGWRIEMPVVLDLFHKLRKMGRPLGEYVNGQFYRGIVTGLNEAFIVDHNTRDRMIAQDPSSSEILKPFLRGRDVKRWRLDPQDMWIVFTRRGTDIKKYPAVYKHLLKYKRQLTPGVKGGRKPGSYKWYEIQDNIAYWKEFEEPKIVYPNICKRNEFTWDENGYYTNQKAFIIPRSSKYLLAVLNSSVVMWLFTKLLAKLQNGFYEPSTIFMKDFPIPNVTSKKQSPVAKLADNILAAKHTKLNANITTLEAEIDARVAHLYELTEEEYSLILKETKPPDPFRVAALNFYRDIAKGVLK
jgi:hypothetical protein